MVSVGWLKADSFALLSYDRAGLVCHCDPDLSGEAIPFGDGFVPRPVGVLAMTGTNSGSDKSEHYKILG